MAKLIRVEVEYEKEFEGRFAFGYFEQVPSHEEMARAYFEHCLGQELPDNWASHGDLAKPGDPPPKLAAGFWRVLLGEAG